MNEVLTRIGWVIRHPLKQDKFHTGRTALLRHWDSFIKARVYDRPVDAQATITRCLHGVGDIKAVIITINPQEVN